MTLFWYLISIHQFNVHEIRGLIHILIHLKTWEFLKWNKNSWSAYHIKFPNVSLVLCELQLEKQWPTQSPFVVEMYFGWKNIRWLTSCCWVHIICSACTGWSKGQNKSPQHRRSFITVIIHILRSVRKVF